MPEGNYVYIVLDTSSGGSTNVLFVRTKLGTALKDIEDAAKERNWEVEVDGWTAYDPDDDGNVIQVEEKLVDDGKGLVDPDATGETEDPADVEEDFSSINDQEEKEI